MMNYRSMCPNQVEKGCIRFSGKFDPVIESPGYNTPPWSTIYVVFVGYVYFEPMIQAFDSTVVFGDRNGSHLVFCQQSAFYFAAMSASTILLNIIVNTATIFNWILPRHPTVNTNPTPPLMGGQQRFV